MKETGILSFSVMPALDPVSAGATNPLKPLDIGSRLEPLVDEFLIVKLVGAKLRLHRPVARDVVMEFDQPWESNSSVCKRVFADGDLVRMYYRGSGDYSGNKEVADRSLMLECYAESKDGLHWTRPELGIVEFTGSTDSISNDGAKR